MTIKEALKKHHKIEIELLLARVLQKPKEFVFLHPEHILPSYHFNILSSLIKRRMRGEPIAYILGYKDFYGLRFKVNKNVLVPRPETEMVVKRVVDVVQAIGLRQKQANGLHYKDTAIKILDIGTGSGCIAISIARQLRIVNFELRITASDISTQALKVAKQNAKTHKVKVNFVKSDLLKNVKGNFDIIIANLPYGWNAWKNNSSMDTRGLAFEPASALYTSENGLYQIRRLLTQIAALKQQPKFIYLEFDPRQKKELSALIKKQLPKAGIKFHRDFANLWRYAEIRI